MRSALKPQVVCYVLSCLFGDTVSATINDTPVKTSCTENSIRQTHKGQMAYVSLSALIQEQISKSIVHKLYTMTQGGYATKCQSILNQRTVFHMYHKPGGVFCSVISWVVLSLSLFFTPFVLFSNLFFLSWCEVVLNVKCFADFLWRLSLDHIGYCLACHI